MGMTASFLPKPVVGVNGNGMHTNVSVSKGGKNLIWDPKGEEKLSKFGWEFVDRILTTATTSACCSTPASTLIAGSIRISKRRTRSRRRPSTAARWSASRSATRRARASRFARSRPDANPYMVHVSVFKTGLDGTIAKIANLRQAERYLPDNIYDALDGLPEVGVDDEAPRRGVKGRYADLKEASRRPVPATARDIRESARGAVPPRSLQPVPLEPVLKNTVIPSLSRDS